MTRRITVVFLLALGALLASAWYAHRIAFEELRATDRTICDAAAEIYPAVYDALGAEFQVEAEANPTFSAWFEENGNPMVAAINRQHPTGGSGSGCTTRPNGLIDGAGRVERVIALSILDPRSDFSALAPGGRIEKVKVEILCHVPWRLFPGKQQVTVRDLGAKHNERYLNEFLPALERRGIAYTTQ